MYVTPKSPKLVRFLYQNTKILENHVPTKKASSHVLAWAKGYGGLRQMVMVAWAKGLRWPTPKGYGGRFVAKKILAWNSDGTSSVLCESAMTLCQMSSY